MRNEIASVYVVDDDASVRKGLDSLLRSVGYDVRCFASAEGLSLEEKADRPSCLLLDVRMPGRSGIDVQADLASRGISIPIVFLTGHGDVPMCAQAMKTGAVDFLLKPFREQALLDAIHAAIETGQRPRRAESVARDIRARFETLTPREREVMSLAVAGRLNKQIAADLGVSEITIKVNRGRAMRKMGANSFADLVVMAERAGLLNDRRS
jgi:FixJ family two-component response regulator